MEKKSSMYCLFCSTEFEKDSLICPKCNATFHSTSELRKIYDVKFIHNDAMIWQAIKNKSNKSNK